MIDIAIYAIIGIVVFLLTGGVVALIALGLVMFWLSTQDMLRYRRLRKLHGPRRIHF